MAVQLFVRQPADGIDDGRISGCFSLGNLQRPVRDHGVSSGSVTRRGR